MNTGCGESRDTTIVVGKEGRTVQEGTDRCSRPREIHHLIQSRRIVTLNVTLGSRLRFTLRVTAREREERIPLIMMRYIAHCVLMNVVSRGEKRLVYNFLRSQLL